MVVSGPSASDPRGPTPDPGRASDEPAGEGSASRPAKAAPSIRAQLVRLVLAALLPAFLFAAVASWFSYQSRRTAAEFDLLQTARAVSAAFDAEFGRRQALLEGLATSSALQSRDLRTFYDEAKAASHGAPIGLHDAADGIQILNTAVPWGGAMPVYDRRNAWSVSDVVRDRVSEVKDVRWSKIRRQYMVPVQTPVIIDGRVRYVLISGPSSDELGRTLTTFRFPANWRAALADRRGVRAARSRDPERFVGKPMTVGILTLIREGREGVIRHKSAEEIETVDAVARSPRTGYSVVVGVPAAEFSAALLQAAGWMFLGGLSAGVLGLTLAAWMAQRISRPLRAAAVAARALGRGARVQAAPSGISEIDVIGGALTEASERLAQRSAERDRQEAELAGLASDLEARVKARTAELDAANHAVAESEARLRAIFESAFQLTGLVAADGRVVSANPAALEAVGATEQDVIGKFLWDTPWWAETPEVRERLPEAFRKVIDGEFVRTQVAMTLRGHVRTFDYSMRPLYLSGGERPDHVLVEGRDITELKAAEERAERSQRMEALGLLTGGVAHDFNNILTVIKGAIEVALKGPGEPKSERLLRAALEASQRGEELNKQLLGFARRRPVTQVCIDPAQAVEQMSPLLRNAVGGARRLELELTPIANACVVLEAAQFETAVLNLVVNARDATPEGGVVTVCVRPPTPEQLRRFVPRDREFICVQVADTGRGIAPENLGRVFDPFFTTKPPGQGTGLGLSQVYGFVNQSAGLIDVQSRLGEGTNVTMALPLERAYRSEPPAPAQPAAVRVRRRILLVEDDRLVADVSEAMLRNLGHEVTTARTAREALEALDRGQFDLLLTDVIMPEGVNGVQLARQAQARRPGLKVLLCSGWTADALSDEDLAKAPWPLLHKPFSSEDLERAILEAAASA